MHILITGGAGFLGHHVCEYLLRTTTHTLVTLDRLDTSSTLHRLTDLTCWDQERHRVRVVWHDLKAPINAHVAAQLGPVDVILHLAACSAVERSIQDPIACLMDNIIGTGHVLEYARTLPLQAMLFFGTDEIFGSARRADVPALPLDMAGVPQETYTEWDRYHSGNPYAASKAGAEELCLAYYHTYGVPVLITHCMNIFAERQHPEKFIPSIIRKILLNEVVPIYADPTCRIPGSRFYIHARNVTNAMMFVLTHGAAGDKYNIVGEREVDGLTMAQMISELMGRSLQYQLVDFHSSRPGHDLRYSLSGAKLAALGWKPPLTFEASLAHVVDWYHAHPEWLMG